MLNRENTSKNKEWNTPQKYVDVVSKFFNGQIDLDPCSNKFSIVKAYREFILPEKDGLKEEWYYKRIFVNPPYGNDPIRGTNIKDWFKKCVDTQEYYQSEILLLVPVATNTTHWKNYVFGEAEAICFLADTRLKFLVDGEDKGKGAPMACAMVYYGDNYQLFNEVFTDFGAVVNISNLKNKK